MTHSNTSSKKLIEELEAMELGAPHREFGAQVVAVAQERGDEELEFDARRRLVEDAVMNGVSDLALANFAWLTAKYDESPPWLAEPTGRRVWEFFWQHSWMPPILTSSPAFSREHVTAILDESEARFKKAGNGMAAVVTARLEAAIALEDVVAARRYADQLVHLEEDDYSSEEVCVSCDYVELAAAEGDEEQAVERALDVWRTGETAYPEPFLTLSGMLVTLVRRGHTAEAVEIFRATRQELGTNRDEVQSLARCAQFASVTGNHEVALALVERHLGWLATSPLNARAHLKASQAFAVALERAGAFYRDTTVVVRASTESGLERFLGTVEEPLTAQQVADRLWGVAEQLAGEFDERNGNSRMAEELSRSRALVDEEYPADLGEAYVFAPILSDQPEPTTAIDWWLRAFSARYAQDDATAMDAAAKVRELADNSADGLLMQWSAHFMTHSSARLRGDAAAEGRALLAWRAFASREFGKDVEGLAIALASHTLADDLVAVALECEQAPALIRAEALVAAIADHRDSEVEPSAEAAAWRANVRDQALALLEPVSADGSEVERIRAAVIIAAVRLTEHADAMAVDRDTEAALAVLNTITIGSWPGLSEAMAGMIAGVRGRVAYAVEDFSSAAAEHEKAARLFAQAGLTLGVRQDAINAARMYLRADDVHMALARVEFALSLYEPDEEIPAHMRWMHAVALVETGEADRAVPILTELVSYEELSEAPPARRATTHRELARAYSQVDDARAIEQFAAAAQLFAQAEMWVEATETAMDHYLNLEWEGAATAERLAVINQAQAYAVESGAPHLVLNAVLARLALYVADNDPAWQAEVESTLELAETTGDPHIESTVLHQFAIYHFAHGDKDVGMELLKRRAAGLRHVGDPEIYLNAIFNLVDEAKKAGLEDKAVDVIREVWAERATLPKEVVSDIVELSEETFDHTGLRDEWVRMNAQLD